MAGRQNRSRWNGWMLAGGLVLAGVGGLAAYKHEDLLTAWQVHQLGQANEQGRQEITQQLAQNPGISAGWLLYSLAQSSEPENSAVLGDTLTTVTQNMTPEELDPLIAKAASLFRSMEGSAQQVTLRWMAGALPAGNPEAMSERRAAAIRRLVDQAFVGDEPEVQALALRLAPPALRQRPPGELVESLRLLVNSGVKSRIAMVQMQAIAVAMVPEMDCLEEAAKCLKSPHKDVRQAAVLALGPASEKISDEILLPSLHDEDPEIVQLAQTALQSRGLRDDQIRLGKLMSDPKATRRLEVLDHLSATRDIDPAIWLRKLSNDPSPAVRVAALRAMSQETGLDLADRVKQMEKTDPSPSVNKLAGYYGDEKKR